MLVPFELIWEARNTILHGTESYTAQAENSRHFRKLLDYKQRQRTLLHHGDTHHTWEHDDLLEPSHE